MSDSFTFNPPGRQLLVDWLEADPSNRTKALVAQALGVSSSAVGQWTSGRAVPAHVYRQPLQVLTGILEDAWVTDVERNRAEVALRGAENALANLPVPEPAKSAPVVAESKSKPDAA